MPELVSTQHGVGLVTGTKERWGAVWVHLQPTNAANSIPLEKWVMNSEIKKTAA